MKLSHQPGYPSSLRISPPHHSFDLPAVHNPFMLKNDNEVCGGGWKLGWNRSCYLEDAQGTNVPTCCVFHQWLQAQGNLL